MKKKSTLRVVNNNSGHHGYGQAPWQVRNIKPVSVHESWMIAQASSILGMPVTLAEARELSKRVDFSTRKPISAEAPQAASPHWLTRALRAVFGGNVQ